MGLRWGYTQRSPLYIIIMKTITIADATFEIQRGMEVGRDFEKTFHKKLEIL